MMSLRARPEVARWLRRGGAAVGSVALDSLEIGKRCVAWLSHFAGARSVAIVALALVVAGGAAWVVGQRLNDRGGEAMSVPSSRR